MGLPSLYGSGDDEEEIWNLVDPASYPRAPDDDTARMEDEHFASGNYNVHQDESDEQARLPEGLVNQLRQLSAEDLERISRFIEEMLEDE